MENTPGVIFNFFLPFKQDQPWDHPGISWLAYGRYNSPGFQLIKNAAAKDFTTAWTEYLKSMAKDSTQRLNEDQMNSIGYQLMGVKKLDQALVVFEKNTIDFPMSANAWDSFAEAQLNKGNKALAIKYYEKALELNPASETARKKLRQEVQLLFCKMFSQ